MLHRGRTVLFPRIRLAAEIHLLPVRSKTPPRRRVHHHQVTNHPVWHSPRDHQGLSQVWPRSPQILYHSWIEVAGTDIDFYFIRIIKISFLYFKILGFTLFRFDAKHFISVAEFEFPTYYNFFIRKERIKLICNL